MTEQQVHEWLVKAVAEELGVAREEVLPHASLIGMGMDSLGTFNVVMAFEVEHGITIEPTALLEHDSIDRVVKYICANFLA